MWTTTTDAKESDAPWSQRSSKLCEGAGSRRLRAAPARLVIARHQVKMAQSGRACLRLAEWCRFLDCSKSRWPNELSQAEPALADGCGESAQCPGEVAGISAIAARWGQSRLKSIRVRFDVANNGLCRYELARALGYCALDTETLYPSAAFCVSSSWKTAATVSSDSPTPLSATSPTIEVVAHSGWNTREQKD